MELTLLSRMQEAIVEEHLDGWLFFHFRDRDPVTSRVLGLGAEKISTRPAYYFVPSTGVPRKIVHVIEQSVFDLLPGDRVLYSTRDELLNALRGLPRGTVAVQYSEELPIISFLDHGTARTLESLGFTLASSGSLIQRTVGVLDEAGIESHERAAAGLYEIVELVWGRINEAFRARRKITEDEVQAWITSEFAGRGLIADHSPIVGCGVHSSDPHYQPTGVGSPLNAGEVLQLDLWAKEKAPGSIYADISWVGVLTDSPPREVEEAFEKLCAARDRGVEVVSRRTAEGRPVSGFEVDEAVRKVLVDAGFEHAIRHRTGHGIDTEDHGSGVNLDSVEFPDHRRILEGSCFSIEPGIYLGEWGLRTEIDLYVRHGEARISGGQPQKVLLRFT